MGQPAGGNKTFFDFDIVSILHEKSPLVQHSATFFSLSYEKNRPAAALFQSRDGSAAAVDGICRICTTVFPSPPGLSPAGLKKIKSSPLFTEKTPVQNRTSAAFFSQTVRKAKARPAAAPCSVSGSQKQESVFCEKTAVSFRRFFAHRAKIVPSETKKNVFSSPHFDKTVL
ncbi:MAG: hypothetical protein PUC47_09045 [Oscillospiraceae bacterium]|nr:hypothetical protein [Oscillospiraceae bacterium]